MDQFRTYVIARAIAKHQAANTSLIPSVSVTDGFHLDNIHTPSRSDIISLRLIVQIFQLLLSTSSYWWHDYQNTTPSGTVDGGTTSSPLSVLTSSCFFVSGTLHFLRLLCNFISACVGVLPACHFLSAASISILSKISVLSHLSFAPFNLSLRLWCKSEPWRASKSSSGTVLLSASASFGILSVSSSGCSLWTSGERHYRCCLLQYHSS